MHKLHPNMYAKYQNIDTLAINSHHVQSWPNIANFRTTGRQHRRPNQLTTHAQWQMWAEGGELSRGRILLNREWVAGQGVPLVGGGG